MVNKELYKVELFILTCVITDDGDRNINCCCIKGPNGDANSLCVNTIPIISEVNNDGYDGVLVKPSDSGAIVDAVAELLDNWVKKNNLQKYLRSN